jgi:hypothetical protein
MQALACLPADRRDAVASLVAALADVRGVVAVALGGSHARGDARPDSDVDLAVYYRDADPLYLAGVRAIARRFDPADPVVTGLYEWGPWVNGGAWLHTRAGKIDLLYRSVEHVARVIDDAERGAHEAHFAQQPPYGYFSVTYLAETSYCVPLADPTGAVAALKRRVATYPEALRRAIVQSALWSVEFTLYAARGLAERGDVYGTAGCATRAASALVQALFALNAVYFATDRTALAGIDAMARRPDRFGARVAQILAAPGATAAELSRSVFELDALFAECVALAGSLYTPTHPLPARSPFPA